MADGEIQVPIKDESNPVTDAVMTKTWKPDFEEDECTFEVYSGGAYLTPKIVWDQRDYWFNFIEKSKEMWDKMTDEQKEAAKRVLRTAMERMYDNVDEWIPEALEADGGDYVDIRIRVIFTDINQEVERFEEATTFQIRQAEKQTKEWLAREKNGELSEAQVEEDEELSNE